MTLVHEGIVRHSNVHARNCLRVDKVDGGELAVGLVLEGLCRGAEGHFGQLRIRGADAGPQAGEDGVRVAANLPRSAHLAQEQHSHRVRRRGGEVELAGAARFVEVVDDSAQVVVELRHLRDGVEVVHLHDSQRAQLREVGGAFGAHVDAVEEQNEPQNEDERSEDGGNAIRSRTEELVEARLEEGSRRNGFKNILHSCTTFTSGLR